jgi:hypothetical protein
MSWVRVAAARLRGLFERKRLERELEDEVRFHLQMQMEDNLKAGMSPAEALSSRASSLARRLIKAEPATGGESANCSASKNLHRIHSGGALDWSPAGQESHTTEQDRNGDERGGIARLDLIEERAQCT